MKKLYLTLCAMLISVAAHNAWAQELDYTSNFYGPGYYRAFNGATGKNLDVVSNIGDLQMSAINMATNSHALHSDAGSILHIGFLDEASLQKGLPYGLYNIEAQGAGTKVVTTQMMGYFNSLLSSYLGSTYPLPFIPVNVNVARTNGEQETVADGDKGPLYQASFNMAGMTALFRDNHGLSQPAIGANFGVGMDVTHAAANLQPVARNLFPNACDDYCNWYLTPIDAEDNYYTPPYNNANADGYINDGTNNWATVCVDFPFVLPEGATAYLVNDSGDKVAVDWQFVPDNTPVLLSWPVDDTNDVKPNDVKLMPGMLSLEQQAQLSATLQPLIAPWKEYSFDNIFTTVTTNYSQAVSDFGHDAIDYVHAFGINMMEGMGVNEDTRDNLVKMTKEEFFAELGKMINQMLQAAIGVTDDDPDKSQKEAAATIAGNIRQLMVNGIRNKFFYDKYNSVFGTALAEANALEKTYREAAKENRLVWCGDFFAYDPDKSANASQKLDPAGYYQLSGVDANGKPLFETPVTEWNGNMAYLDPSKHSLQWIVNDGTPGDTYKVSDKLQVMYVLKTLGNPFASPATKDSYSIFAKDNDNFRTKDQKSDGSVDYMTARYFTSVDINAGQNQYASTQANQSNWIRIDCSAEQLQTLPEISAIATATDNSPEYYANAVKASKLPYITDVKLTLRDNLNPQADFVSMTYAGEAFPTGENTARVFNTYIPASFYEENGSVTSEQKGFFFISPKPNEIAIMSWSVYDGSYHMYMPKSGVNLNTGEMMNEADLKGGYPIKMDHYKKYDNVSKPFEEGQAYQYFALITKKAAASSGSPKKRVYEPIGYDNEQISSVYEVYPLYSSAQSPGVVTSVATVSAAKQVAGVEYVNLAGQRSARPWGGVNIVVTRYSDGTTASTKALF